MKIVISILFTLLISNVLLAQQVTKVDCCLDVNNKATIIVNDNITNLIATNSIPANATVNNNKCNFKLNTSSNTSAGIYNSSDNLVRTLWSGVRYDAGCYSLQWDGLLDDGTQAPFGSYTVKILTNNVQYTWEGVIGNTSTHFTGDSVYRGDNIYDLCFVGNKGFFANGYSERGASQRYFTIGNSNAPSTVIRQTTQSSYKVWSDGNIVYWAGNDTYTGAVWVYGAYPADNGNPYATQVPFSAGISYTTGLDAFNYSHAIGLVTRPGETNADYNQTVNAFAGQKNGYGFLYEYVDHVGKLLVLNKTTGATLQTLNFTGITGIACDAVNGVYIAHAGTVEKFIANQDGTLTTIGTTVSGISNAGALTISPDFSLLSIADNTTNQVKNYSLSTLTLQFTLGTGESYSASPYVSNNKFYGISFLSYQPDGSLWVGDPGNYRYQHFNSNGSYKEQIAYVPGSRSSKADRNNPTHIFADELEFHRDYSKTLDNGTNGSWALYANWKPGTAGYVDIFSKFTSVVTLSNGHTYATGRPNNHNTLFDLTPTGAVLLDGNFFGEHGIESDGTVFTVPQQGSGYITINKNLLTGFDQNNKPIWGNPTLFATSPLYTQYMPWNLGEGTQGQTAASDRYVFFNNNAPSDNNVVDYHLGAVKAGQSSASWLASRGTFLNYAGDYPHNGDFDTGNGSHSGTHAYVYDNDVFWNVNCEFWGTGKSSQPQNNIWNHFNNDGLFIGQFGLTGQTAETLGQAAPGMAGNALYNAVVKYGNDYYVYHCDESYHAGVHSWHVTGLNTIAEQSIPLTVSAAITVAPDQSNLMTGLPFKSTSFTSGNGWTATGATASTNTMQYLSGSPDIEIGGANIQSLTRSLNNTNTLSSWSVTGGLNTYQSQGTLGGNQFNYLELLDQSGKTIARFQNYVHGNDYHQYLIINDITFADGPNGSFPELANFNDFSLSYSAGVLTFKYANHAAVAVVHTADSGAAMAAPASIRINQSSPGNQYHQMDLYKLRFVKTN